MKPVLLIAVATTNTQNISQAYLEEYYLPLSLLYLSGSLEQHFQVGVLDLNTLEPWTVEKDEANAMIEHAVQQKLRADPPFLVGISCLFSRQIGQVLEVAKMVKSYLPHTKVVIGGIHPTIFSEDILQASADIDFVILGEGEQSTLELARALRDGQSLSNIDGLTYRTSDGRILCQPKTRYIENPDDIPKPAYHLFDFDKYRIDTSRWHNPKNKTINVPMPFVTSRSCPNKCNFCVMFRAMGPTFRARSAAHVLDEMEFLYHEYGTNYFEIFDDNFSLNKKRTLEICRGITARKLDIQLRATNGLSINSLDDETIDALAEAGMVWIPLAIESGSAFIRNKIIGKHLNIEKVFKVAEAFKRHPQIILTALFIIGMPEETPETLQETYDLIQQLDIDDCSIANAIPFPGTALYEICVRENLLVRSSAGQWNSEDVVITNRGTDFFIKPYMMTIEQLTEWRVRFDELRFHKMSPKYKSISRVAKTLEATFCSST